MTMQPDTPDFAGSPTENANSPEQLYIPHENIRDMMSLTDSDVKTLSEMMRLGI